MLEIQPKPDLKVSPLRGPHFYRLHDQHVKEADGEPVMSLPLDVLVTHLDKHAADPELFGTIHDILANAGISLDGDKWRKGCRDWKELFTYHNEGAIGKDGSGISFVKLPDPQFAHLIAIHHGKGNMRRKQAVMDFAIDIGLEPNEPRILKDFCTNCGKKVTK